MKYGIGQALLVLRPGAEWNVTNDVYTGIEWLDKNQTKPTEEEVNEKISELEKNEPHRLLREERNKRLAECDWVVTKYAEYGYNIPKEWRVYRQALRDLPSITYRPEMDGDGVLKMDSVAWPTPPE